MKRVFLFAVLLLGLLATAKAQPSTITVTGTLYKSTGAVCASCTITISKARTSNATLGSAAQSIQANGSGVISFTAVQNSFATVTGPFVRLPYNFANGVELYFPAQASISFDSLKSSEDSLLALVSAGGNAPAGAKFIVQVAVGDLPNAQSLGALTTGLLKNSVSGSTGTLSTAVAGTDYENPLTFAARLSRSTNTIDLANSGVSPGTYTSANITVDAYGRVTAAANGSGGVASVFGRTGAVIAAQDDYTFAQLASKPTSLSGYGITDGQPLDPTLTALAGLNSTAGLVEQTGADTFTKRLIGVANATDVPTRGDADGRFAAIIHTHAQSDVTNLVTDLALKAPLASPAFTGTPTAPSFGRVAASGTDQAGSSFAVYAGAGTGAGLSGDLRFQLAITGSTGSSPNSLVDRQIITKRKALTDAADVDLVNVTLPSLAGAGGFLDYTVYASDGTDIQIRRGVLAFSVINKAGSYTAETSTVDETASASAGSLACTFNFNPGSNQTTLRANCDTSLTPSAGRFYIIYQLRNQSEQAMTIQ